MKLQNAAVPPEFTHVRHYQYAGFVNGNNEFVPTRMTIVSRVEGDSVVYKVGFCSKDEPNFNKKEGRQAAYESAEEFEAPIAEKSFEEIETAILRDLVKNRREHMPFAHRKFAELIAQDMF